MRLLVLLSCTVAAAPCRSLLAVKWFSAFSMFALTVAGPGPGSCACAGPSFCTLLRVSSVSRCRGSPGWGWLAQHCSASGSEVPATVTRAQLGLVSTVCEMQLGENTAAAWASVRRVLRPWWWMKFHCACVLGIATLSAVICASSNCHWKMNTGAEMATREVTQLRNLHSLFYSLLMVG